MVPLIYPFWRDVAKMKFYKSSNSISFHFLRNSSNAYSGGMCSEEAELCGRGAECAWSIIGSNRTISEVKYAVQNCFRGTSDKSEWFQRGSGAISRVSVTRNIWNITLLI
jgi:hypothetical protein